MADHNPYVLGRVHSPDPEAGWMRVELLSGYFMSVKTEELPATAPDTLVLVSNNGDVEPPPEGSTWPIRLTALARVELVTDDRALLVINGLQRFAPIPASITLERGDLVSWDDLRGIEFKLTQEQGSSLQRVDKDELYEPEDLSSNPRGGMAAVGGLESESAELIRIATSNFASRAKPETQKSLSGIVLFGEPGTGKTHLVRCMAEELSADLFVVSGPEVMSRFVGETEESIRAIFSAASKYKRSIIFFDEFDSIGPRRDKAFNDHVRIQVGQLLAVMDGAQSQSRSLVIASTNRLDDIDPAFLRPGRFEYQIELKLPDETQRAAILLAQAPAELRHQRAAIGWLAAHTHGWSPAELGLVWSEARSAARQQGMGKVALEDLYLAYELVASSRIRTTPRDPRKDG